MLPVEGAQPSVRLRDRSEHIRIYLLHLLSVAYSHWVRWRRARGS